MFRCFLESRAHFFPGTDRDPAIEFEVPVHTEPKAENETIQRFLGIVGELERYQEVEGLFLRHSPAAEKRLKVEELQ